MNYVEHGILSSRAIVYMEIILSALNIQIAEVSSKGYFCRPPYRKSKSGRSLFIDKKTGLWIDHGDHCGGNIIHLVEKVLFGTVTKGRGSSQEASFREACFWLNGVI